MGAIAGTAYVKADGISLSLGGSLNVSPLTKMREGKVGLSGVVGYKETPRIPFIEVAVFADEDFSIDQISGISDATVTAELSNGKTYVLRQAWLAGEPDLDGAEGETTLRFEGLDCQEVSS